jgi:hypothetical protein
MLRPSADFHEEEVPSVLRVFSSIKQRVCFRWHAFQKRVLRWIKPPTTSFVLGTLADVTRGKAELLAENALLRHQLIILHRQVKQPVYRKTDRLLLVLLARLVQTWKQALFLVQPETVLRWHRELFRMFWKHTSKVHARKARLSLETISLIKEMAAKNRLWGAERIRGELRKLDMYVSKRTIQKYMRHVRAISAGWTDLENVLAPSCGRDLGLRFLAGHGSLLSSHFRLLHYRIEVAKGHACECDSISD